MTPRPPAFTENRSPHYLVCGPLTPIYHAGLRRRPASAANLSRVQAHPLEMATMFSTKRSLRMVRLRLERLEARDMPTTRPIWGSYAHDPQHTDISAVASQPLETVRWSTPVDLAPNLQNGDILIHYGSPLVTANNTVLVPVKTNSTGAYRIEAHNGGTGQLMWEVTTDYTTPPSGWTPSFSPVLTPLGRLSFQGPGGTVYFIDNRIRPLPPCTSWRFRPEHLRCRRDDLQHCREDFDAHYLRQCRRYLFRLFRLRNHQRQSEKRTGSNRCQWSGNLGGRDGYGQRFEHRLGRFQLFTGAQQR